MTNNETRQIMYEVYGENINKYLTELTYTISKNMGVKEPPNFQLGALNTSNAVAMYNHDNNIIMFDLLKLYGIDNESDKVLCSLAHECEHAWQWNYYPETVEFFAKNSELYLASYDSAFNLIEADAYTVEFSYGRKSLRKMFECYNIKFFTSHSSNWQTVASSMQEHYQELFHKDEQGSLQGLYKLLSESKTDVDHELSAFQEEISLFS